MSVLRWPEDAYLFVLGALSFGSASIGYLARKHQWRGWTTFHIVGMGVSYIVLLTAFYVDNGPRLPVYDRLPVLAFWTVPALIGFPLLIGALARHTRVGEDLRASWHIITRSPTPEVALHPVTHPGGSALD
jgi:hypothetical protein